MDSSSPSWDPEIGNLNWRTLLPSYHAQPLPSASTKNLFKGTAHVTQEPQSIFSTEPYGDIAVSLEDTFSPELRSLKAIIDRGVEDTAKATDDAIHQLRVAAKGLQDVHEKDGYYERATHYRAVGGGGRVSFPPPRTAREAGSSSGLAEIEHTAEELEALQLSSALVEKEAAKIRSKAQKSTGGGPSNGVSRAVTSDGSRALRSKSSTRAGHSTSPRSIGRANSTNKKAFVEHDAFAFDPSTVELIATAVASVKSKSTDNAAGNTAAEPNTLREKPEINRSSRPGTAHRSKRNLFGPSTVEVEASDLLLGGEAISTPRSHTNTSPKSALYEGFSHRDASSDAAGDGSVGVVSAGRPLDAKAKAILSSSRAAVPESIRKMQDDLLAKYADIDDDHRHADAHQAEIDDLLGEPILQAQPVHPEQSAALRAATKAAQAAAARAAQHAHLPGKLPGSTAKEQLAHLKANMERMRRQSSASRVGEGAPADLGLSAMKISNSDGSEGSARGSHTPIASTRIHKGPAGSSAAEVGRTDGTSPSLVIIATSLNPGAYREARHY